MIWDDFLITVFAVEVLLNPDYGNLPEADNYLFLGMLQSRKKYGALNDRTLYKFTFSISPNEPQKLYQTLQRLFGNIEDWVKKEGSLSVDMLSLYITLNPRNERKAMVKVCEEIVSYLGHQSDCSGSLNLNNLTFRCLHKSPLIKSRIILDFDINPELDYDEFQTYDIYGNIIRPAINKLQPRATVKTHSGYHVYLDLTKLDNNTKRILFNGEFSKQFEQYKINGKPVFKDVEIKTDPMIVIPGTLHGGRFVELVSIG